MFINLKTHDSGGTIFENHWYGVRRAKVKCAHRYNNISKMIYQTYTEFEQSWLSTLIPVKAYFKYEKEGFFPMNRLVFVAPKTKML